MASQSLQDLVNSAQLKLFQFIVTALAIPGCMWFGARTLSDLDTLKANQQMAAIQAAEMKLRVDQLEKAGVPRQEAIDRVREQLIRLEYEFKVLKEYRR
jgi:hypothetical protein